MSARLWDTFLPCALGGTFYMYLNYASLPAFQAIMEECFTDLSVPSSKRPSFLHLGVPLLDHWMCFYTGFFTSTMSSKCGLLFTRELLAVGLAALCLVMIESMRSTARGFARLSALFGFLAHLLGPGVVFPFWLSSYWAGNKAAVARSTVNPEAIAVLATGVLLRCVSVAAVCIALPGKLGDAAIWLFVLTYVAAPLFAHLPSVFGTSTVCQSSAITGGSAGAWTSITQVYNMVAGACLTLHIWGRLDYLPDFDSAQLWDILRNASQELQCAHFMAATTIALFSGLWAFVAAEFGTVAMLRFGISSFVIGPGASTCFYLIQREQALQYSYKSNSQKGALGSSSSRKEE